MSKIDAPSISFDMLWPLLTMILGFTLFFLGVLAMRVTGRGAGARSSSRAGRRMCCVAPAREARLMSEFLAMGGYAKYVWSSFGITTIVLVLISCWRPAGNCVRPGNVCSSGWSDSRAEMVGNT